MRSRTVWIARADCKDRHLYRLDSRNLRIGVFRQESADFVGIRTKFGSRFLEAEMHWDANESHGTVKPIEELERLPDEIRLPADLMDVPRDDYSALFGWIDARLS